jgi:spore maturation protein CgeB
MKIIIFGLTVSSSWANGHATLWRGLCRALHAKGHLIVFYERDVPYYAGARDYVEIPGGELVLYQDWPGVQERVVKDVTDADVAMVTSYCPDAIPATRLVVESRRPLAVFYDLDTPVTLGRLRRGEALPYIGTNGLAEFDLVLSYTGGRALDELRTRLGARVTMPLYGHVDPDIHRPVEPVARYQAELSYLGTFAADRQSKLEALFIEPARRRSGQRFLLGGAQYPHDFPWSSNIFFVRHLAPSEHPAFFSSSRMTLNVTRSDMAQMGWCPSGRLFEAAACGTAILSDDWDGLETFFKPNDELFVARTTEDAVAMLDLDAAEIRRVGAAARERTLAEHTSARRADELLLAFEHARTRLRELEPMEA